MLKLVKDKAVKLEYGMDGNFGVLTPKEIVGKSWRNSYIVKMDLNNGYNSTIELCFKENEIDFKSFE